MVLVPMKLTNWWGIETNKQKIVLCVNWTYNGRAQCAERTDWSCRQQKSSMHRLDERNKPGVSGLHFPVGDFGPSGNINFQLLFQKQPLPLSQATTQRLPYTFQFTKPQGDFICLMCVCTQNRYVLLYHLNVSCRHYQTFICLS